MTATLVLDPDASLNWDAVADDLELAMLGWADWFDHARIHSRLDNRTPAEIETDHYRVHNESAQRPFADQQAL